jgi:hypothetical protein
MRVLRKSCRVVNYAATIGFAGTVFLPGIADEIMPWIADEKWDEKWDDKWDELFMTFGHNDGMKMGLGCCGRARMRS